MPGLSFLSKKSWNTSNIANVEKVWLAEQKAEAEKKKLDELQKQLSEERQIQELRQLQVESGVKVKTVDTSLDWMYQGPSAELQKQQSSEEYLLGKIFKPKQEANIDFNKKETVADTAWMAKVTTKNDAFTRVHEDPILMIRQEEKRKREMITSNPIKMDKIRKQISSELEKAEEEKRLKKLAKKEKKDKKKESKHHKKSSDKKRDRSASSSEDSEDDRRKGRSASPPRRVQHQEEQQQQQPRRREAASASRSPERRRRVDSRSRSRDRDNRESSDRRRDDYSRDSRGDRGGGGRRDSRDYRDSEYRGGDRRGGDRREDSRSRYTNNSYHGSSNNSSSRGRRNDSRSRSRSPERRSSHYERSRREDSRDRNSSSRAAAAAAAAPNHSSSSSSSSAGAVVPAASASAVNQNSSSSSSSSSSSHVPVQTQREDTRKADQGEKTESDRDSYDSDDSRAGGKQAPVKYGLIAKNNRAGAASGASKGDDKSLGPSAALLQKKLDKERQEQELRQSRLNRTDVSKLSEEERQRRVAAMQQDAEANDVTRNVRLTEAEKKDKVGEKDNSGSAAFLESMRKTVYTTSGDMGERLNQNRHYVQSSVSMDHDNSYRKR